MDRPVVLNGPPASGKTTLGPRLAERLGYDHVDLDRALEARAQRTVGEILAYDGEPTFRAMEHDLLRELLARPRTVISAGGGALVDRRARHDALRRATVVSLSAPPAVLLERLREGPDRPLVTRSPDPPATLAGLLDLRREAYAEAHGRHDTSTESPEAIVDAAAALHARAPLVMPLGERSHRVEIAPFEASGASLAGLLARPRHGLLVTDRTVADLWPLDGELPRLRGRAVLPPGERAKSLRSVAKVWDASLKCGADRAWLLLCVGGGVITDLGGFAAATLLRGVRYASVPTTLLAMVDASVGGKTAVDHARGKNLVGAFHHPSLVWIDPRFASTLTPRDWRAGLAEAVKVGAALDPALLDLIEQNAEALRQPPPRRGDDPIADVRARMIRASVQAKIDVVAGDERESGARAVLNFGHTIGHAVEHASGYRMRHGECVAVGMAAALDVGVREGVTPPALRARVLELLEALGLPLRAEVPRAAARKALGADKKRDGALVRFVLLEREGAAVIRPLPRDRVDPALVAVTSP